MSKEKETRAAIERMARRLKESGLGSYEECRQRVERSANRHDRNNRKA